MSDVTTSREVARRRLARLFMSTGSLYGASSVPRTPSRISLKEAFGARCSDGDSGAVYAAPVIRSTGEEHSVLEIAAALGLTHQAISQAKTRAIAKLRLRMEDVAGERIGEGPRIRRQVMACSNCGESGHRRNSCKKRKRNDRGRS